MSSRELVVLPQADRDIRSAVIFYSVEAGSVVAARFIDALGRQYRAIARHPATGSLRFADELNVPGLRTTRLGRFPYLIFYRELPDRIEILRVLHARRDIGASLP